MEDMLPNRKPNRIPGYDYANEGAYFITICTKDRKQILSKIVGDGFPIPTIAGNVVYDMIGRIPEKYPNIKVDNFVIMPDHIHILIRIPYRTEIVNCHTRGTGNPSPTMGNIIGWFKYEITKQLNLQANSAGVKYFQRSYYDHVIRNQQDYNEIWEYIDNNPRKWIITNDL